MEGEPNLSLLGSLELPDFDGAFWFDKLDDLDMGDLPGQSLGSTAAPVVAPIGTSPKALDHKEDEPLFMENTNDAEPDSDPSSYDPLRDASPPPQKRRRGRGRAKSNLSVEDRRLKNREIQARYRAKQKREKDDLEATCIQVSGELDDARQEHVIAQHTKEIMEKVLVIRDAAVGILAKCSSGNQIAPSSTSKDTQESNGHPIGVIENPKCVINGAKSSDFTSEMSSEMSGAGSGGSGGSGSSGGVPRAVVVQHVYKTLSTDIGAPVRSIAEAYDAGKKLDETGAQDFAAKGEKKIIKI
jgi:hypothetical protein